MAGKKRNKDMMDLGEFLAQHWSLHRDRVVPVRFEFPGGVGFGLFDQAAQPHPEGWLIASWDDGKIRTMTVHPAAARADVAHADLFRQAVAGALGEDEVTSLPAVEAMGLFGLDGGPCGLARRSAESYCARLPDQNAAEQVDVDALAGKEATQFDAAGLSEIRSRLSREALRALRAVDEFNWADYSFYAMKGERGAKRQQAAEVYPLLAALIARRPSLKIAVDSGKPLNDALRNAFGTNDDGTPKLSNGMLKRLQNLEWPTGGIAPEKLVMALGELPPDWFPKDRRDWDAFCDLTATVGTTLRDVTRLGVEVLYKDCGGKWADFAMRCAKAYTDTRPPEGLDVRPPECLQGAALKAVQTGIDWKAAEAVPKDAIVTHAHRVATEFRFPEGVAQPDAFDPTQLADWIVRYNTLARLNASIDWQAFEKMAPEDVPAAAARAAETADAPDYITRADVIDWIVRLNAPDTGRQALHNACLDVEDMITNFAYQVVMPIAAAETGEQKVFISDVQIEQAMASSAEILFSAKAAPNIFELSRHWHTQQDQIRNRVRERDPVLRAVEVAEDGWAPLTASVQAPNGVWLVPLTDPRQLENEGRRGINEDGSKGLHHCVAGYANKCREHGYHIVSVRMVDGNGVPDRLSTFEVSPVSQGKRDLKIRQHRGRYNRTPPDNAIVAYEWYLEQIRAGNIPINFDRIRIQMQHEMTGWRRERDDVERLCGYEWRERDARSHAMLPWGAYVSKKYRRMKIDEFAAQPEIVAVRQSISPTLGYTR